MNKSGILLPGLVKRQELPLSLSTASAHPSCKAELDSGLLLRDSDDPRVRRYASAFADVMEMRASSPVVSQYLDHH